MSDPQFARNLTAILAFALGVIIGGFAVDLVSHTTEIAAYNMRTNYEWLMTAPHEGYDGCERPSVPRRADFDQPEGARVEAPDLRF
jgi:hypothetical protein